MTRKKKSRSLKRIHSVKTGNISKLKRSGTVDRQNSNLKAKSKPKSVYQKFLDENPDAVEKQVQASTNQATADLSHKKDSTTEENKKSTQPTDSKSGHSKNNDTKNNRSDKDQKNESNNEREPDLLSQLDNKNFNDFY